jgi:hypothetical protein
LASVSFSSPFLITERPCAVITAPAAIAGAPAAPLIPIKNKEKE